MADAITSVTPPATTATTPTTSSTPNALSQLNAGDFIKVMLAQLQQQDPLNPSDSNQLLTQMSQIGQLQANSTMNTTLGGLSSALSGFSLQQSITAGAGLMGKYVQGLSADGQTQIQGNVSSVTVANSQVQLNLDNGTALPLSAVTGVFNQAPVAVPTPG